MRIAPASDLAFSHSHRPDVVERFFWPPLRACATTFVLGAGGVGAADRLARLAIRREEGREFDDRNLKSSGGTCAMARPPVPSARRSRLLDVLVDELGHLEHRNLALAAEDRLELVIGVDHPTLLRVLQVVALDVRPELFRDLRARHRIVADDRGELRIRLHWPHERGVWRALRATALAGLLRGALLR